MLLLDISLVYIKLFITIIGVAIITIGAMYSLYQLFMLVLSGKFGIDAVRYQFGKNIMLGLDFIVGADIIGSLAEPSYYSLGLLAILVAIRIVLSFFLSRELEDLGAAKV